MFIQSRSRRSTAAGVNVAIHSVTLERRAPDPLRWTAGGPANREGFPATPLSNPLTLLTSTPARATGGSRVPGQCVCCITTHQRTTDPGGANLAYGALFF